MSRLTDAKRTNEQVRIYTERLLVMVSWLAGAVVEFKAKNDRDNQWRVSDDPDMEPAWQWELTDYRVRKGTELTTN